LATTTRHQCTTNRPSQGRSAQAKTAAALSSQQRSSAHISQDHLVLALRSQTFPIAIEMDAGDAMERGERAPLLPEVTAEESPSLSSHAVMPRARSGNSFDFRMSRAVSALAVLLLSALNSVAGMERVYLCIRERKKKHLLLGWC